MDTKEVEVSLLADGELEQVSGGMSKAMVASNFYAALGDAYSAMGLHGAATEAYGTSTGIIIGSNL